jgi:flagellar biosynthesis protein FlhG
MESPNTQLSAANHPDASNIIAIASGKGGVGKTWFAITLSHIIARSGRRVLLFDGDIGLANVDVQLGLTPPKDLGTVFAGKAQLKEAVMHYASGNFDIIAGRSGSTSLATIPQDRMEAVGAAVHQLAQHYDTVILDLGAGIEKNVQYLSSLASKCVVIVNDEPTSLTDAYSYIKLVCNKPNMPSVHIVINSAASQKEGDKTYEALNRACKSFLGFSPELLGVIRRDNKIREAIRAQKSLISIAPATTAASDVAAISLKLLQRDEH